MTNAVVIEKELPQPRQRRRKAELAVVEVVPEAQKIVPAFGAKALAMPVLKETPALSTFDNNTFGVGDLLSMVEMALNREAAMRDLPIFTRREANGLEVRISAVGQPTRRAFLDFGPAAEPVKKNEED